MYDHRWTIAGAALVTALVFVTGGWGLRAEDRPAPQEKRSLQPHSGPKTLVPPISPPAVVDDWERPYPQYQPVGQGETVQAPDLQLGTENPPDIHTFGGKGKSSFVFDLSPDEPLDSVMKREQQERASNADTQRHLLQTRYDLTPRFVEGVTMTRGKPVPKGPTANLPDGMSWEDLSKFSAQDIRSRQLFPYLPLPHPLHSTGGMVFPQIMTDLHPERERFDVAFDIPDHFLPEFPPPLFLTSRPDLGDVSRGQEITESNFYELFDGVLSPVQFDGVRLLVEKIPQQQFNATDDRKTVAPSRGVACLDCHVNGHTNGAIHLNPDNRPQMSRFRIETPSLRGVNIQDRFGSKRALASVEDFTEFENRSAYFDHDQVTAEKKGRRDLTRNEVMKMAQFQKLVDFPPLPNSMSTAGSIGTWPRRAKRGERTSSSGRRDAQVVMRRPTIRTTRCTTCGWNGSIRDAPKALLRLSRFAASRTRLLTSTMGGC